MPDIKTIIAEVTIQTINAVIGQVVTKCYKFDSDTAEGKQLNALLNDEAIPIIAVPR